MSLQAKRAKRVVRKAVQRAGLVEGPIVAEAFYLWVQSLARTSTLKDTPFDARRGIFRVLAVVALRLVGVLYIMAQANADLLDEYGGFITTLNSQLYDGWAELTVDLTQKAPEDEQPS
jgi:hypothetical protein